MEKTKAYPHPIGVAAGLTAGVVYIICAIAVALWPAQLMSFFANWFHGIDLTKIAVPFQLTFGSFFAGLLGVVLFFYIVGLVYGLIYNMCCAHCKKRGWI